MPWLEKRGEKYRVKFRYGGESFQVALATDDPVTAAGDLARIKENLRLLNRGRLELPPEADVGLFLLSDGKLAQKPALEKVLTVGGLSRLYSEQFTTGAKEANTREVEAIHLAHVARLLGKDTQLARVTAAVLQGYADRRCRESYRGRPIKPQTVKKELATFRTVWGWGHRQGHVLAPYPAALVVYAKGGEKSPFRTFKDIQDILSRGTHSKEEVRELWGGLFLSTEEVAEVLGYVRTHTRSPWLYPFFVAAAHTGARRSELLRARVEDFDFENRVLLVREKKKSRTKETFRTVDMTGLLADVMAEYFRSKHPGGRYAFSLSADEPIAPGTSTESFRWVMRKSKWNVMKGFHVFRHSFASNMAAAGVDEHVIAGLMGHLTEDMRKRYRHLFPKQRRSAVASVFGE